MDHEVGYCACSYTRGERITETVSESEEESSVVARGEVFGVVGGKTTGLNEKLIYSRLVLRGANHHS